MYLSISISISLYLYLSMNQSVSPNFKRLQLPFSVWKPLVTSEVAIALSANRQTWRGPMGKP